MITGINRLTNPSSGGLFGILAIIAGAWVFFGLTVSVSGQGLPPKQLDPMLTPIRVPTPDDVPPVAKRIPGWQPEVRPAVRRTQASFDLPLKSWFDTECSGPGAVCGHWHPQLTENVLSTGQLKRLARVGSHSGPSALSRQSRPRTVQLVSYLQEEDQKPSDSDDQEPEPEAKVDPAVQQIKQLKQQLETRRAQINDNENMDAASKGDATNQLIGAENSLQEAEKARSYIDEQTKAKETFATTLQELQEKLATLRERPAALPEIDASPQELSNQLKAKETEKEALSTSEKEIRSDILEREKRVAQIASDREAAETQVRDTEKAIDELEKQPDNPNKALSLLVQQAKLVEARLKVEKLLLESQRLEQTGQTLPIKRDVIARELELIDLEIKSWNERVNAVKAEEIKKQKEQADRERKKIERYNSPRLKSLAKQGQDLATMRSEIDNLTQNLSAELARVRTNNDNIEEEREALQNKIATLGMTTSTGMLLIDHRRNLAPTALSKRRLSELANSLRKSQAKVISLNETRNGLRQKDQILEEVLVESPDLLEIQREQLILTTSELLSTQIKLIDDLLIDIGEYHRQIFDVEVEHRSFVSNIDESKVFIQENALWIRSAEHLTATDLGRSAKGLKLFLDRESWNGLSLSVGNHILSRPYELAVLGLVAGTLWVIQRRLRWSHE